MKHTATPTLPKATAAYKAAFAADFGSTAIDIAGSYVAALLPSIATRLTSTNNSLPATAAIISAIAAYLTATAAIISAVATDLTATAEHLTAIAAHNSATAVHLIAVAAHSGEFPLARAPC